MAHHRRGRSKRQVRCTMCTQFSWMGNTKERKPLELSNHRDQQKIRRAMREEASATCSSIA